jgi:hypothetical protein
VNASRCHSGRGAARSGALQTRNPEAFACFAGFRVRELRSRPGMTIRKPFFVANFDAIVSI